MKGNIPLVYVVKQGNIEIMNYLQENGADLKFLNPESGKTIIHYACETGVKATIEWCINNTLNVNMMDKYGDISLMTYLKNDHMFT